MISFSDVTYYIQGRTLFDKASFLIQYGDKIGLVGKNGAGKSTLLRLIVTPFQPESGTVNIAKATTVGYLPQELVFDTDQTVLEYVSGAFDELLQIEARLEEIHQAFESGDLEHYDDMLNEMVEKQERYDVLGGSGYKAAIEKTLSGLGFEPEDSNRPLKEFSGGWQMRAELAKILLRKPDCILLDEPTNHLDIESVQWLEKFLKQYEGAIMMVSHDKTFLDSVTNRTIEITSMAKLDDYPVAYSRFVELREERIEHLRAAAKQQGREIASMERFIERFRYKASLASRAQSRMKMLDKIERIQVEDTDTKSINFSFPDAPRSGAITVKLTDATKAFPSKTLFKNVNLEFERGQKIAFVGRNGEGKSTLARIIRGDEPLTSGTVELGYNVKIGYYAQHQNDMLDPSMSVYDALETIAVGEIRTKLRAILGAFLFSGDDVNKKVGVLSGGEKSRLSMARLLLEPVNLLILDEPTNHLDMFSKDILKEALQQFTGALIVISHDREFLTDLVDTVVEIRQGNIKEYAGDIMEYLRVKELNSLQELEYSSKQKKQKQQETINPALLDREQQKEAEKRRKKLERECSEVEKEVQRLEAIVKGFEEELLLPRNYTDHKKATELQKKIAESKAELNIVFTKWASLQEELEVFA